jgi:kynurenine formamidase
MAAVRREISRRGFVATAASAVAASLASPPPASAQQRAARLERGFREVFDLTHTFSARLPVFPAFRPVQIRERFTIARDGFFARELTFDEHTGTHMDAPAHFVANAPTADRIAVDRLIAPLVVVSVAARAAKDPDTTVTREDLAAWEKQHGRIPPAAFVAMHSGWDGRAADPDRFLNRDAKGTLHAPGFSEAAARFLVEERDIVGAGVDTLSLDPASAQKFSAHLVLLGAGKYGVELLANLGSVPASGATVIVAGPTHEGASGGPARVLAVR